MCVYNFFSFHVLYLEFVSYTRQVLLYALILADFYAASGKMCERDEVDVLPLL
jgi:hypothetical protein